MPLRCWKVANLPSEAAVACALAGLLVSACSEQPRPLPSPSQPVAPVAEVPPQAPVDRQQPVFVDVEFRVLHQLFLLYGFTTIERSDLWTRFYKHRWIHWTGELRFHKRDSLLFRMLAGSGTYDVRLYIPKDRRPPDAQLNVGRFYTFMGRLTDYDDVFKTITLDQGTVFVGDSLGVPGFLMPPWPMARAHHAAPKELRSSPLFASPGSP
jgi:hypothetical protein